MNAAAYFVMVVAAGCGAGVARLLYSFFPGANVMDFLVFGALASGFAYMRPRRWWLWAVILIAPAMLFVSWTLANLGVDNLRDGVGVGYPVAAVVIPLAAAFGGFLTAKWRIARELPVGPEVGV